MTRRTKRDQIVWMVCRLIKFEEAKRNYVVDVQIVSAVAANTSIAVAGEN